MEVLAQTEYQDIYRITDGVLLVVNKFHAVSYNNKYPFLYRAKCKRYNKGCQNNLKVLKENYYDDYNKIDIPIGTVFYNNQPVELVEKCNWEYQIKTTSDAFSDNYSGIMQLINNIIEIIEASNSNGE